MKRYRVQALCLLLAAALALTSALPERAFAGEYDRLFGSDDETKTEMEIEL